MVRSKVQVSAVEASFRCCYFVFPFLGPIFVSNLSFGILLLSMYCLFLFIMRLRSLMKLYLKVGCLFFSANRLFRQPSSYFTISHLRRRFESNLLDFVMYSAQSRHLVCIETVFDCLNSRLTVQWPMLITSTMMAFCPPSH